MNYLFLQILNMHVFRGIRGALVQKLTRSMA